MSDDPNRLWDRWYEGTDWHSTPAFRMEMARHLNAEHGLSVRQINRRLGLTDLEVRHALEAPRE